MGLHVGAVLFFGERHWLPELDANFFGNNWLSRALVVDLEKFQF